ncbi:hypothetical protein BDW67DRAFT_155264 [Aspergillus spinulosporus]
MPCTTLTLPVIQGAFVIVLVEPLRAVVHMALEFRALYLAKYTYTCLAQFRLNVQICPYICMHASTSSRV